MVKRGNGDYASKLVRQFVPLAKVSALLLVVTTAGVACIYGARPLVPAGRSLRSVVLLAWFWNVCVFVVCGGMVLWGRLVDRYGDPAGIGRN